MNRRLFYVKLLDAILRHYKWIIIIIALIILITNLEFYLVSSTREGSYSSSFLFFIFYCEELIFVLLTFLWIFPVLKKKIPKFQIILLLFISWILCAALFSVILRNLIYYLHNRSLSWSEIWTAYLNSIYRHGLIIILCGIIYITGLWVKEKLISNRNQTLVTKLEKENLHLQSSLLGAQMNPHLLVNVLNAIQGNIMEKSPESYYLITGIADIQEHLLTKSNIEQITTLADEIQLIQKVLDLYSDLGKKLGKYNLLINAPIERIPFPANLLVPLIENIFKHGDLSDSKDLPIVNLQIQSSFLELHINNKALPQASSQHRPSFGIRNCIKRLDTYFSNSYKFTALTNGQWYQLILEIKLKNYD